MTACIKRFLLVLLASAALLGSTIPASAEPAPDYTPDYRGDPNSVHAVFEWLDWGVPWAMPVYETGEHIFPLDPTEPGALDDGTDTVIQLPNFIDPLPVKHMRIQMGFDGAVSGELLAQSILIEASDPAGTPQWSIVDYSPGDLNWHYVDIDIWPNPDSEVITIFGESGAAPGNLLYIEVDTVSVPEPMTMSLLAAGGLALLRRRRK